MTTAIETVPTAVTGAGLAFNYANWSAGTVLATSITDGHVSMTSNDRAVVSKASNI